VKLNSPQVANSLIKCCSCTRKHWNPMSYIKLEVEKWPVYRIWLSLVNFSALYDLCGCCRCMWSIGVFSTYDVNFFDLLLTVVLGDCLVTGVVYLPSCDVFVQIRKHVVIHLWTTGQYIIRILLVLTIHSISIICQILYIWLYCYKTIFIFCCETLDYFYRTKVIPVSFWTWTVNG